MSLDLLLRGTLHLCISVDPILSVDNTTCICLHFHSVHLRKVESVFLTPQNLSFGWTYKLVGGYGETKLFYILWGDVGI